jgi:hypothetical protein
MDDLSTWLLDRIAEREAELRDLARDPYEGMSDDELHDRRAHPAFEYETTEGPRKAWDFSDIPPRGKGWERNETISNPEAWERFAYHEESYWRRLRPDGPEPWQPSPRVQESLAECDAKRRIVELHQPNQLRPDVGPDVQWGCKICDAGFASCGCVGWGEWPCGTVKLLALSYVDRPGYREEWAV